MVVECFHLMVCFFAENEESYLMVGMDVVDAVDVWGHEFEDEHDVVTSV